VANTAWENTWGDKKFIEDWASKGSWQAPIRNVQTAMVLRMIPQPIDAPIRVLDVGAGYGALAAAVLRDRPNATAVCLDASEAMLDLGPAKNPDLKHRMTFVRASLESPDWLSSVDGAFDAVVSARALHHFTENQRRRAIFKEIFDLVRSGGGFINADNVRGASKSLSEAATPSSFHGPHNNGILEEELAWLREAGFHDVDCFWKFTTTVVYGGFKN
jgi:tRNA (cmo5U34)-methyltransferase